MQPSLQDENFMREALDLARQGTALAFPNPQVGAVIVDPHEKVVGRGFHTYDGVKHAEVLAIEEAGEKARGATLYLNLEPCSHHGRTGPCADAVIAAGVKRVFAAMEDPNQQVHGQGIEKLRAAGVEVHVGLLQQEARDLNEAFAKFARTKLPLVTLKAGMTLDGKIAPPPGDPLIPIAPGAGSSVAITSLEAHNHVHRLRHQSDAIMVGVGTVIADDPLLTDRTGLPRRRPLLRVVLDSRLRLPLESRLVKTVEEQDLIVFCSFAEERRKAELEDRGIRVCQVAMAKQAGHPDLAHVVRKLGEMNIASLLIEGGANVNWVALESGLVDKIFLYYAPKILGGSSSVPLAGGRGFRTMDEAAHAKKIRLHQFGEDFAVEGYLKDPYTE
ncbi:MAG: bifunctional diaminohydroxyphosphoribosylaminopyrimidine deaminase/5-amino-6-(5-phosphoribosylamino)uracil reductase RibD [Terriglobales bacterium]